MRVPNFISFIIESENQIFNLLGDCTLWCGRQQPTTLSKKKRKIKGPALSDEFNVFCGSGTVRRRMFWTDTLNKHIAAKGFFHPGCFPVEEMVWSVQICWSTKTREYTRLFRDWCQKHTLSNWVNNGCWVNQCFSVNLCPVFHKNTICCVH